MRQILETEEHVQIPPLVYSDPFYRITYLIKEEIRKYKWIEGEKGRKLSWEQARQEWTAAHREKYEKFQAYASMWSVSDVYFCATATSGSIHCQEKV